MPSSHIEAESISISGVTGDPNRWLYRKLKWAWLETKGKNIPLGDCGSGCQAQQSPEELSGDVKSSVTGSRSSHQEWCSGAVWHGWSCFPGFVCHCFAVLGFRTGRASCEDLIFVWENHMALSAGTAAILSLSWWPGKAKSWWWTSVFECKPFSFSILLLSTLLLLLCVSYSTPICFQ